MAQQPPQRIADHYAHRRKIVNLADTHRPRAAAMGSNRITAFVSFRVLLILIVLSCTWTVVMLGDALSSAEVKTNANTVHKNFVRGRIAPRPTNTTPASSTIQTSDANELVANATTEPTVAPTTNKASPQLIGRPGHDAKASSTPSPTPPTPRPTASVSTTSIQRGPNFDATVSRDRGVILSLHNGVLALGVSLIRELRCLGNTELIQIYHCFQDELSQSARDLLFSIDHRIEIVDVCSDMVLKGKVAYDRALHFMNWWVKPLALHHTDVAQVILLDTDDLLLMDPASVRQKQGYQDTGTLFFYDRVVKCSLYLNKRVPGKPPRRTSRACRPPSTTRHSTSLRGDRTRPNECNTRSFTMGKHATNKIRPWS